jgi:hypothetical protein
MLSQFADSFIRPSDVLAAAPSRADIDPRLAVPRLPRIGNKQLVSVSRANPTRQSNGANHMSVNLGQILNSYVIKKNNSRTISSDGPYRYKR